MIENLINKSSNKKYYQSLKYFSHSLKGEKRIDFIKQIANRNVLLASQCVMTCEKDVLLEDYIANLAFHQSNENDIECKVAGLLSLIELNRYELIYSALSKINKINNIYRYAIKQIIGEIDSDSIIKLLRIILETRIKGLVSSLLVSVDNREIEFSSSQKAEIESMFNLMVSLYGYDNQRTLKYLKTFNLSKKLIPKGIDRIAMKRIRKGDYEFITDFYSHFHIPFPFSPKELCEIYITKNTQKSALAFSKCFFQIEDISERNSFIEKALKAGKYFAALFIAQLKSSKDRQNAILLSPDVLILKSLIKPFTYVDYPDIEQNYLIELIQRTFINKPEIEGKIVTCKVTGTIPKTIFVDILPSKAKGTIWVKEYSSQYIEDISKIVKLGDIFEAIVIGIGDKYVQLSVRQLIKKETTANSTN